MEIKLNDKQKKINSDILRGIISNKEFSNSIQKYYSGNEIQKYVKEACLFYDENIKNVTVTVTNDDRTYCDFLCIDKEANISSIKTMLIPSFKNKEEDFEYLIMGEIMACMIFGQQMQMKKEPKVRVDKLVFIQHSKLKTGEATITNLSIVFYVKERGTLHDRITITN